MASVLYDHDWYSYVPWAKCQNTQWSDHDGIVYPYRYCNVLGSDWTKYCSTPKDSVTEMQYITTRSPIREGINSTYILLYLKDQTACIDLIWTILLHNFSSNQILAHMRAWHDEVSNIRKTYVQAITARIKLVSSARKVVLIIKS